MTFPRVGGYYMNRSWGEPLLLADKTPNEPLLRAMAGTGPKTITTDIPPWYSPSGAFNAEPILLMRRYNPRLRPLPYTLVVETWLRPGFPPANPFHRGIYDMLSSLDGWVKNPDGTLVAGGQYVNISKRTVADAFTDMLAKVMLSGVWDRGIFLDCFGMGWIGGNDDPSARSDNLERMARTLGKIGPVIGNGIYANQLGVSGSMVEMAHAPLTQFEVARRAWQEGYEAEPWLQWQVKDRNAPDADKVGRFAIGTGCLFGAITSVGYDRDQKVVYHGWWWVEQGYDLGDAMGPARVNPNGVWVRHFTKGCVLVNPTNYVQTHTVGKGWVRADGGPIVGDGVSVAQQDAVFLFTQAVRT